MTLRSRSIALTSSLMLAACGGGSSGDRAVPSAGNAQRPFGPSSPWNATIPAGANYVVDERVAALRGAGAWWVNFDGWTVWVWEARPSDPLVSFDIIDRYGWGTRTGTVRFRVPASAHPDTATFAGPLGGSGWAGADRQDGDFSFNVIDETGRYVHEMWQAGRRSDGTYFAVSYVKVPLDHPTGVGISGPNYPDGGYNDANYPAPNMGAARAYGGAAIAGLIRAGETATGINHALALALPNSVLVAGEYAFKYPATHSDGTGTGPIVRGQRFAIPRSLDISSLGLPPAHRQLALALQKYGAFVVDTSSNPCFYSDAVAAQADGWALNDDPQAMATVVALLVAVDGVP